MFCIHTLYTQTWGPVAQRIIKYLPIFHKRNWIDWIQQFGSVPKIFTFLLFLDNFKSPKSVIYCIFIQFHKSMSDFEIFSNRLCSISDILISSCFFLRWSIEHDKNTGLLMTSTCLWAHTGLLCLLHCRPVSLSAHVSWELSDVDDLQKAVLFWHTVAWWVTLSKL